MFFAEEMDLHAMNAGTRKRRRQKASTQRVSSFSAARKLEGAHDFRNLCKMDVVACSHFERRMLACSAAPVPPLLPTSSASSSSSAALSGQLHPDQLCEVTVVGEAFLYHQIRCLVAVLFMVPPLS
jgi:tRNA pseudouridine38/39 synthase